MEKLWYLKRINIFGGLSESEMHWIDKISEMREFSKKQPIYLPGETSDKIYLLKSGKVKIKDLSEDGKEFIWDILDSGEIFGETTLFGVQSPNTMAEALEDVQICVLNREDFEELLKRNPEFSLRVTKLIGLRRKELQSRISDLIFRDVHTRLAHLILDLSNKYGREHKRGTLIKVKLTHYDIASLIGSTRETTTVCLNDLKREGLIDILGKRILILDMPALKKRAQIS